MHDIAGMGIVEGLGDITQDGDGFADGESAVGDASAERMPIDVGHRIVGEPFGLTGIEDGDDVRVLQPGSDADLALEAVED